MKIKAIKYNKNGLTRADNTVPKLVMPKKDLNNDNTTIVVDSHYFVIKKQTKEENKK